MTLIATESRAILRALTALLFVFTSSACGDERPRSASAPVPYSGAELVARLGCAGCHPGLPASPTARRAAGGLAASDPRRDPAAVFAYLAESPAAAGGEPRMPEFRLGDEERVALARYLAAGSNGADRSARRAFDRAVEEFPAATAERGRAVFAALNCASCHSSEDVAPWAAGPDLRNEGDRVRPEWLRAFLRDPHRVRPAGFQPGTGSRMPDFALSRAEADSIAAYLMTQRTREGSDWHDSDKLTAREGETAAVLIRERYSCLGCHRWDGAGGRIGPDLGDVRERLQPEYVRAMILAPQRASPGSAMPKQPMPDAHAELIARYLLNTNVEAGELPSGVVAGTLPAVTNATPSAPALYTRHCAACHGTDGRADGFNAPHLATPAALHASADSMSLRTDDRLYDGIHAGAFVLSGSPQMPAFGELLGNAQIRALVAHIRELCRCAGPAWSTDGQNAATPREATP